MTKIIVVVIASILIFPIIVKAASIEKAETYRQNGLIADAKKELIDIIFSKDEKPKPEAYYILGNIAYEEKNISSAIDSWKKLVNKYPKSSQAVLVKDRIKQLAEITGETTKVAIENLVAQSYLSYADFWSEGKDVMFNIDPSWINPVDAAIKWYDKIILEYPKSEASKVAYQGKLKTLLGWKQSGIANYGLEGDNFTHYIDLTLSTFAAFEAEHPDASTLQAFRYQIAQVYWKKNNGVKQENGSI